MDKETVRVDYSTIVDGARQESKKYILQGGYALAMGATMAGALIWTIIEKGPELTWSNLIWGLMSVALIGNSLRLIAGARRVQDNLSGMNESNSVTMKKP